MFGYKFIRKDNKTLGDEIVFYINDQLQNRTRKTGNPSEIEILTIEITIRKNQILVAGIDKPPNLSETNFTISLKIIIKKIFNFEPSLKLRWSYSLMS